MMFNRSFFGLFFNISSLSNVMDTKKDLFSFFRLAAAFLVLYAHSYHIYGLGADPLTPKIGIYTGTISVYVFFTISGFFIFKSAMDRSIPQFLLARIFRIYPALIVCNLLTIIFLIPISMHLSWWPFFSSVEAQEFLKINSILETLKFSISGVFENNPDKTINGSLWTLPVEVRAYIIALLIVMSGIASKRSIFNSFFIVSVFLYFKFPGFFEEIYPIPHSMPLLFYFLTGGALYINRSFIPVSPFLMIIASIIVIKYRLWPTPVVVSMLFSYVVISSGYLFRGIGFNLKNDYSYGCYLYAYPVSQLSYVFFSKYGFYYYQMFIIMLTMMLSFASWHLIEKNINILSRKKIFPKINGYIYNKFN